MYGQSVHMQLAQRLEDKLSSGELRGCCVTFVAYHTGVIYEDEHQVFPVGCSSSISEPQTPRGVWGAGGFVAAVVLR